MNLLFCIVILFYSVVSSCGAAKILFLIQTPVLSHFISGQVLAKELVAKGHEVTMVSAFPQKIPLKGYVDIVLTGVSDWFKDEVATMVKSDYEEENFITKTLVINEMGYEMSRKIFNHENVRKLMESGKSFDVVIVEHFVSEALYGLCHVFKAPCIALSPLGPCVWNNRLVGNIGLASYVPELITSYSSKMSFFERLRNLIILCFQHVVYHFHSLPKLDELMHEHIPDAPPLVEVVNNISLVLLNSHPALIASVPTTPNMIEIGGLHVQGLNEVKLPQDVQQFLDEHEEGVVYFALGSIFRSQDLPVEKLQAIFTALKKFGKPILWKYEGDLPDGMHNVKTAKWFPQTAVLAHKNVKAFITHCGRLSSLESLYHGVPMIGISLFGEQAHNAAEMVYLGYALWIKFKTLNVDNFYDALIEITSNPKYSNEAKLRSKAMRKENAIEKAIYWIEHVIEFKGAAYLRTAGIDLPWYQFWMLDVLAFVVVSAVIAMITLYYLTNRFYRRLKTKGIKIQIQKSNNHKKKVQ